MKFLSNLLNVKPKEPEVRRALDVDTGQPIPMPGQPVDWKWRALNALSAVFKYASIVAWLAHYIPGEWALIAFAVASATKDVSFIVADWIDNGKRDSSYKPPTF